MLVWFHRKCLPAKVPLTSLCVLLFCSCCAAEGTIGPKTGCDICIVGEIKQHVSNKLLTAARSTINTMDLGGDG